jgi:hypothetical protein
MPTPRRLGSVRVDAVADSNGTTRQILPVTRWRGEAAARRGPLLAVCRYPRAAASEEPTLVLGSRLSDKPLPPFRPLRRWQPELSFYSSASSARSSSARRAPLTCAQKLDLRLCLARIPASKTSGDSRWLGPVKFGANAASRAQYLAAW